MKSLIAALIVGVILFAISAGVSWVIIVQPMQLAAEKEAEAVAAKKELIDAEPFFPEPIAEDEKVEAMPVANRPREPMTVEAVTELAQSIMQKETAMIEAEKRLRKEKKRLDMLFEDLRQEHLELTAFGEQIDMKILQAREALQVLKLEKQSVITETNKLSVIQKKNGTLAEAENRQTDERVKLAKNLLKGLDPEIAALHIKEYAARNGHEFASRVLQSLERRQMTKIVAAMNDVPLVADLIDAYTKSKPSGLLDGSLLRR